MSTLTLTERQQREADYYQQFVQINPVTAVDFAPVLSSELRPWSPYWRLCDLVRQQRTPGVPQRLLDFGCGWGVAAVTFARLGYEVHGFDVAQANIDASRRLAASYDMSEQCHFRVMPAEKLDYLDHSFDVAVGVDILHHVELPAALAELARVLKPGGVAILKEPFVAPLLDRVRTSALVRRLATREKSFVKHVHITDDERKLTQEDAAALAERFDIEEVCHFSLCNRFSRFLPRHYGKLMRLDYELFRFVPGLRHLGDVRIYVCRNKSQTATAQAGVRKAA
jgi:2-polyprenyl-3-methyl-5-hydroxy-6-metoxy-1,4-benzoquinol methylase